MSPPPRRYRPLYTRLITSAWVVLAGGLLGLTLYVWAVSENAGGLFGDLPDLRTLENPRSELASEMFSADGQPMGKYFRENRSPVTYSELPANLVNALLATEDVRFADHSGIDFKGTFAILYYKLTGQKRGSSTISQQLAKNLFRTRSDLDNGSLSRGKLRMLIVKTKEWIMAVKLERAYSKPEILTMYLNTVDFGSNAFGIKTAAKTFFGKTPQELTPDESAMLVGLLKAPSYYSPVLNPANALRRRNTVLNQMQKYGYLDVATETRLAAAPIKLKYNVENSSKGIAPYFRAEAGKWLQTWCREHNLDLYADGLRIHTTIDARLQRYAEEALAEHLKNYQRLFDAHWAGQDPWIDKDGKPIQDFLARAIRQTDHYRRAMARYDGNTDSVNAYLRHKRPMTVFDWRQPNQERKVRFSPYDSLAYYKRFLHAGFLAMDPLNGRIRAWVGGPNFKFFKYDHVKQGRRQPGSTFKPIVYTAAIDNGFSPCYEVADVAVTFPAEAGRPPYTPKNFEGHYTGRRYTLREALARSINSVTAFLVKSLTPQRVVDYAKRLGITGELEPLPPIGFGIYDVSIYEMVGAYGTFVNHGVRMAPVYITRIEDKAGNILYEYVPTTREVLSEQTAYVMLNMLQATTGPGGTAVALRGSKYALKGEIGAKTGTTSNYSDAWFMGLTPDLVCGTWVGGEDRSIHFRNGDLGQGARQALPIYGLFMKKATADKSITLSHDPFPKPEQPLTIEIDCYKYKNGISNDSTQLSPTEAPPAEDGDI
jgi:penicillin-binding protein 1A